MVEAVKNLSRYDIRTPFLLTIFNLMFIMLAGPMAIIFYAVEIFQVLAHRALTKSSMSSLKKNFFQEAGNGQVNSHLAAIISAVVRLLGGILAVFIVQRVERVRHAMTSMTIMGLSMISLGTILYFRDSLEDTAAMTILPILCVSVYLFAFGAGMC